MGKPRMEVGERVVVERSDLDALFAILQDRGYETIGPTVREGAIVYDELHSTADLPVGWTDEQDGGHYRLVRRKDAALFGYVVGPHSWKKFLHPPALVLWKAKRTDDGFTIARAQGETPHYAFIGVRPCELRAIEIQDRVFLGGDVVDPHYQARRERAFIAAVNCVQAGGTCFCASMDAGPGATSGFDLALTEILEPNRHVFLLEVGTELGAEVAAGVPHRPAPQDDRHAAEAAVNAAAAQMGRSLDPHAVKQALVAGYEHPRWDHVARRCLTCANCTMVCPTCFCTAVEDTGDLAGQEAERVRHWDSCFALDFSYIHGGSVRVSAGARYRHWMMHKLATWQEQFGTSGCVGCGRCITWCPVGIDITEEARVLCQNRPEARADQKEDERGDRDL